MDMAQKIKYHREKLGMTLEELGNKVGVGKSTVRKWETGMIANMRRDKISKIADALEVSPSYLMGWVDNPDPDYPNTKLGKIEEISSQVKLETSQQEEKDKYIAEAIDLYGQFQSASPEIRAAIETLLKSQQRDS